MFKIFKRLKYAMLSKIAEYKLNKSCGCNASIKIKLVKVREKNGEIVEKVKTEIIACEKDYKKVINSLLIKGP